MEATNPVVSDADAMADRGDPELPMQVEIRSVGADDLEARYVNLATLNYDRAALYLTLSQFPPPTISGPQDANRIAEQRFVPAKAVARFVLTPLMAEELVALLETQLASFNETHGRVDSGDAKREDR